MKVTNFMQIFNYYTINYYDNNVDFIHTAYTNSTIIPANTERKLKWEFLILDRRSFVEYLQTQSLLMDINTLRLSLRQGKLDFLGGRTRVQWMHCSISAPQCSDQLPNTPDIPHIFWSVLNSVRFWQSYKGWIKSSGNSSIVLKWLYYLR